MNTAITTLYNLADGKGVSMTEWANRLEVSRAHISNIKVKNTNVGIDKYIKMADVIGYELVLVDKESGLKIKL